MKNLFLIAAITATITAQASGNFSMIEINPDHGTEQFIWTDSAKNVYGAGEMSNMTEMNGKLYFIARSRFDDDELWSTDGTPQGTSLVKDINPNGSAQIGNLVKVGNHLLFMAADNNNWDFDIWSTDGTETGTVKVADVNQSGNTSLAPENVAPFGNRMIFCSPTQLMITDGTIAGTDSIMAITQYSQGFGYCELNNKVYFILNNSLGQNEIWRTDGTTMGTQQVINVETAPANLAFVSQMISFNGKIYLVASEAGFGNNLYSFDGTVGGQIQKIELAPGSSSYPANLTLHNGAFYFTASTMASENVFRITTSNGVPQELIPNAALSWISSITFTPNNIYFLSENQQDVHRIDLSNLNHSITHLEARNIPSYINWNPYKNNFLIEAGSKLFFSAYDSLNQQQKLLSSDEDLTNITEITPDGANIAHPFNAILGCGMADVFDFFVWNDKLILPANFNDAGRELWILETGTANGISEVKNENSFTLSPNPSAGEVKVNFENSGYCDREIRVVNVNGEVVTQKKLSAANGSLSLSGLSAGNYFATVTENGKAIGTEKLVLVK